MQVPFRWWRRGHRGGVEDTVCRTCWTLSLSPVPLMCIPPSISMSSRGQDCAWSARRGLVPLALLWRSVSLSYDPVSSDRGDVYHISIKNLHHALHTPAIGTERERRTPFGAAVVLRGVIAERPRQPRPPAHDSSAVGATGTSSPSRSRLTRMIRPCGLGIGRLCLQRAQRCGEDCVPAPRRRHAGVLPLVSLIEMRPGAPQQAHRDDHVAAHRSAVERCTAESVHLRARPSILAPACRSTSRGRKLPVNAVTWRGVPPRQLAKCSMSAPGAACGWRLA